MNEKLIMMGKKKAIILNLFIVIFTFLMVTIIGPAAFRGTGECLAAEMIKGSFSELVKKASSSVVHVSVVKTTQIGAESASPFGEDDPFKEFFDRFYGDQIPKNQIERGTGTGFIIDKEGYILTNNHVVEGVDEIKVLFSDKKEFPAKVVGLDSKTDLALIKIDGAKDLVPLALGDSDKMEVGDLVVAIGNPFGFDNTVTAGIVSAKYRRQLGTASYEDYIQTDAAINQGNSGGPLINLNGEVIGINSNIWSPSGGSVGIGFAIPINMAKDLLPQLKKGKIIRGWLGVTIQPITVDLQNKLDLKDTKGALVGDVTEGGPAGKAGIETGDVIVSFDGKVINEADELPFIVAATPVGKTAKVEIIRNGQKRSVGIKVGELKDEEQTQTQSRGGGEYNRSNELGFTVGDITPDMAEEYDLNQKSGVIIFQVESGSPAEEAGLAAGDIVSEIDRVKVNNTDQFNKKIKGYKAGDTILFLIKREGSSMFLTLKVGK